MGLKSFLINIKMVIVTCFFGFSMVLSGCASSVMKPSPEIYRGTPQRADELKENTEKTDISPRVLAALQLTEQGRMFLENNQPDDAIGILERALNLNPDNGRNYYYLAEAWLVKGNIGQATEFNRLAEIYLKDDGEWLSRVILQRERIKEHGQ
jgi:predicted Zn-dependent protease